LEAFYPVKDSGTALKTTTAYGTAIAEEALHARMGTVFRRRLREIVLRKNIMT